MLASGIDARVGCPAIRGPDMSPPNLIGIGLYTPAEAARLISVPASKIVRWLRGHTASGRLYDQLWKPQVDLGDDRVYLGFRDLMEIRTADAFMQKGISAVMIRRAIIEARKFVADERPLSTTRFKTDGRSLFFELITQTGDARLIDIFKRQYAFREVIEQSLKDVDFDGIAPGRWWPATRAKDIVIDPARSFGQPIDQSSGVPTAALAAAAQAEGSIDTAARFWLVPPATVRRAVEFERTRGKRAA